MLFSELFLDSKSIFLMYCFLLIKDAFDNIKSKYAVFSWRFINDLYIMLFISRKTDMLCTVTTWQQDMVKVNFHADK